MSKTDQSKILYSPQKCIFSIARGVHKTDAVRNMSHFHFHEIHEIIYVASGIITYYVGKEAYILKPGDFFLINMLL